MSRIAALDLHLLELPLIEPFVASHGTTSQRTIVVIMVSTDAGVGWGECSALPAATYSAESATSAFTALVDQLAPLLIGAPASVDEVRGRLTDFVDQPMAISGLEMAVLNAELKAAGASLANWFHPQLQPGATVTAGVSLGLDSIEAMVTKAKQLVGEGYRRLKIKIQPSETENDLRLVEALRDGVPETELHLDANGSYQANDIERLIRLVDAGATALEQPFSPADRTSASELIRRLADFAVPVVADEAVASVAEAHELLDARAMSGLSIKPGRVGGLTVAKRLHELCEANNLAATAGGMLETGLGRHALAAMAAMSGFTLTGDLSPASRWLAADPWPDLELIDGRITVPTGPGVAPPPDPYVLDRYRLEHRRVGATGI